MPCWYFGPSSSPSSSPARSPSPRCRRPSKAQRSRFDVMKTIIEDLPPTGTTGNVDLGKIREEGIRRWRKERLTVGPRQPRPFGPVTVAKAYRLLRGILTRALEDGLSSQAWVATSSTSTRARSG